MSDKAMFIVADSLRFDYATSHMVGELFEEESWNRAIAHDTYTAACMPTILSGSKNHGNTDFLRRIKPTSSLLHDHESVMWSHTFGNEKSMLKFGKKDQFDIRGFEDNTEHEILDWLEYEDELPELVVYHSMITHWPFGTGKGGEEDIEFEDGIYIDDKRKYNWTHENYRIGVNDMIERVQEIADILEYFTNDDWTIILTADHGEGLGENGVRGHIEDIDTGVADWVHNPEQVTEDVSWSGVEKMPWTIEVPFVVNGHIPTNRDSMRLREMRSVVSGLLDTHVGTHDMPKFEIDFLGDEYTDMSGVEQQLEDLGYK